MASSWCFGLAGVSLHLLGRVGTHDPTNSFKAYSRDFICEVGIESDTGFSMGIELVAKAKCLGRPVAEIPTIWLDRAEGTSNFKMSKWLGRHLRWYVHALKPSGKRPRPRPPQPASASPAQELPRGDADAGGGAGS
jgi:hypothetical protein